MSCYKDSCFYKTGSPIREVCRSGIHWVCPGNLSLTFKWFNVQIIYDAKYVLEYIQLFILVLGQATVQVLISLHVILISQNLKIRGKGEYPERSFQSICEVSGPSYLILYPANNLSETCQADSRAQSQLLCHSLIPRFPSTIYWLPDFAICVDHLWYRIIYYNT